MPASSFPGLLDDLADAPVLAWLGRRDFERARRTAPIFAIWRDHGEFTAERDALHIGYATAGVTAQVQPISFRAFERWSRLTGALCDIDGLDEFAAHWRWRANNPDCPVRGFFGAQGEFRGVAVKGAQCVRVERHVFARWRDNCARAMPFPPLDLDAYATLVVQCCLPSANRVPWPAVSSERKS